MRRCLMEVCSVKTTLNTFFTSKHMLTPEIIAPLENAWQGLIIKREGNTD